MTDGQVTTRGAVPGVTVSTLPQGIVDAIKASHVSHTVSTVKISAKASPTKKEESSTYDQLTAHNAQGMAVLCAGKLDTQTPVPEEGDDGRTDAEKRLGAADHFNYGFDLARRARTRAKLVTRLEGPDKAIEKATKALVDADVYATEDEARAHVMQGRAARAAAAVEESDPEVEGETEGDSASA